MCAHWAAHISTCADTNTVLHTICSLLLNVEVLWREGSGARSCDTNAPAGKHKQASVWDTWKVYGGTWWRPQIVISLVMDVGWHFSERSVNTERTSSCVSQASCSIIPQLVWNYDKEEQKKTTKKTERLLPTGIRPMLPRDGSNHRCLTARRQKNPTRSQAFHWPGKVLPQKLCQHHDRWACCSPKYSWEQTSIKR